MGLEYDTFEKGKKSLFENNNNNSKVFKGIWFKRLCLFDLKLKEVKIYFCHVNLFIKVLNIDVDTNVEISIS